MTRTMPCVRQRFVPKMLLGAIVLAKFGLWSTSARASDEGSSHASAVQSDVWMPHNPVDSRAAVMVEKNRGEPRPSSRPRSDRRFVGDLPWSARHLDHGILQVAVAVGTPARNRFEIDLGLFDHLSLGATFHWLLSEKRPRFAPQASIAFVRGRAAEFGMTYRQTLHPRANKPGAESSFEPRTHWLMGALTVGRGLLSSGFDAGVASRRVRPSDDPSLSANVYVPRVEVAGGLHARVGTRRIGLGFEAALVGIEDPDIVVEAVLDLRFGLFERRPSGGWRIW